MRVFTPLRLTLAVLAVFCLGLGAFFIWRGAGSPDAPAAEAALTAELARPIPYEDVVRNIVPHKALYRLRLVSLHSGSPISELGGEMFFKWEDTCDAWSTDHRFRIDYYYTDRPSIAVTSHFISWEEKNGNRIHFLSEGYTDGILDESTRGESYRREDMTGIADYREPAGLFYELGKNFFFPAQHTIATIAKAQAGADFFNAVMFDGTDDSGPSEINAFINQSSLAETVPVSLAGVETVDRSLLDTRSWNVRLAFFPLEGEARHSSTPAYEMLVRLHENGVVSDIVIEYDKFSVRQQLVALEALPPAACGDST